MKARFLVVVLLLFSFVSFAASDSYGATLTVTKTADTNDGICDSDCSLREAVSAASPGDTIVFSPLFNSPQTISLNSGQMMILNSMTVNGPGTGLLTVSGNNASRIFQISNGAAVSMNGMTLANGRINTPSNCYGGAIYLLDSTLTLTNMVLQNNTAYYHDPQPPFFDQGSGGAIYSINSTLSIISSTIDSNTSSWVATNGLGAGGGIYSGSGMVNITDSVVSNNSAEGIYILERLNVVGSTLSGNAGRAINSVGDRGISITRSVITGNRDGGFANFGAGSILTIDDSIISENESITFSGKTGGGISNSGTATITNTTIRNNLVSGRGGGIFNIGAMNIMNSAVINNRAGESGGGIYNSKGHLIVTNSTVSGNTATGLGTSKGGGIYNAYNDANTGARLTLTNSTITNNGTIGKGGGLLQDLGGVATIRNSIVSGNTSTSTSEADVSAMVVSYGINLIGNTTGSVGWLAEDLLNRDPMLAPLGNNGGPTFTHALLPSSPAVNAGSNAQARDPITNMELANDQRRYERFVGTVDIGAYEANYSNSPVTISGRVHTNMGRSISRVRITLMNARGTVMITQSNPYGYFRFVDLLPGSTYTIAISHKYYQFGTPQVVTIERNRSDFDFIGN